MQLDPGRGYDIIGDVHGCAYSLEALLERLDYRLQRGVWRHPTRQALFLGDIIDRGPNIRRALHTVYNMVQAGAAHCLMGNHEFYALAWHTLAPAGSSQIFVREHNLRHQRLMQETSEQFANYANEWQQFIAWFSQLPLFMEHQHCRLVHAYWDEQLIETLKTRFADGRVDLAFFQQAATPNSFAHQVFNRLLRGINLPLPQGLRLTSHDGYIRESFRSKFWVEDHPPQTYGDVVFQPDALPEHVANLPLPDRYKQFLLSYDASQPILFVGHYWRSGIPNLLTKNVACLDYSAVQGGKLVAYRLDQETHLQNSKFVWVDVDNRDLA